MKSTHYSDNPSGAFTFSFEIQEIVIAGKLNLVVRAGVVSGIGL